MTPQSVPRESHHTPTNKHRAISDRKRGSSPRPRGDKIQRNGLCDKVKASENAPPKRPLSPVIRVDNNRFSKETSNSSSSLENHKPENTQTINSVGSLPERHKARGRPCSAGNKLHSKGEKRVHTPPHRVRSSRSTPDIIEKRIIQQQNSRKNWYKNNPSSRTCSVDESQLAVDRPPDDISMDDTTSRKESGDGSCDLKDIDIRSQPDETTATLPGAVVRESMEKGGTKRLSRNPRSDTSANLNSKGGCQNGSVKHSELDVDVRESMV